MRRWPDSLAGRVTLVTVGVAMTSVLLTGLVSLQIVRSVVQNQARAQLVRQVDALSQAPAATALSQLRVQQLLGPDDVQLAVVDRSGDLRGPAAALVDRTTANRLVAGEPVSTTTRGGLRVYLVEGRPLAAGGAVVAVQSQDAVYEAIRTLVRRITMVLGVGLLGAVLAGVFLARRITRPLVETAAMADRLAHGERGLRVRSDGPHEVTDLAHALTALDSALTASEGRQREFLLSVSHEIRTPLTAIRGYAEALADGVVAGADVPGTGRTMLSEAQRLDRFVADLLELARLEADDFRVELQQVDVDALLEQTVTAWTARCRQEGVGLRVERPDTALFVTTDGMRVRQVLDGLTENALRATPDGGHLVLAVRAEGSGAVIEVRDTGPGLTAADVTVAFDRGALHDRYQGTRAVGTGLGLSIAHRLMTRLGGTVTAGTAPEGGACFSVHLPGPTGLPPTGLPQARIDGS